MAPPIGPSVADAPIETQTPSILAGGSPLAETWLQMLTFVRVDRGVGLVGRATLKFMDTGFALSASSVFSLGRDVVIKDGSQEHDLMVGTVTALSLEQPTNGATQLVVTVDDHASKLAAIYLTEAHLNKTFNDIIREMVGSVNMSAELKITTGLPQQTHDYLLQSGSCLDYLNWMSERSGSVWWIDHAGTLVVDGVQGTSAGGVSLDLGSSLHSFSVRAARSAPDEVKVSGWASRDQTSLVGDSASKKGRDESDFVRGASGRSKGDHAAKSVALVTTPAPFDATEAAGFAKAMMAVAHRNAVVARGSCVGTALITLMTDVTVTGAGPASGTYRVTQVEHVYTPSGFLTHFTCGPVRPRGMVDLLGGPATGADSLHGVLPAVVTDTSDKDGLGRARVKFTTIAKPVESTWARIVTLGAGKSRGMVFQPEVGDEVLVAFEQGDVRRPVILGGLFSKPNALPSKDFVNASGGIRYRRITSRKGHVLEFSDGDGDAEEHILVKLADGTKLRIGQDKIDLESKNKPIKVTNGGAIFELKQSGDVVLDGNNITIKAKQKVSIEALEVDVKAQKSVKAEGQVSAEIKGGATAKVEGGANLTLKGGMVMIN